MPIRRKRGWELPERAATPEPLYRNRRRLLGALGLGGGALIAGAAVWRFGMPEGPPAALATSVAPDPSAKLYPVPATPATSSTGPDHAESYATGYNNFLRVRLEQADQRRGAGAPDPALDSSRSTASSRSRMTLEIDDLLARMPLEERLYRHRCVEAWSMVGALERVPAGQAWSSWRGPRAPPSTCRCTTFHEPGRGARSAPVLVSLALYRGPDDRRGDQRARLHRRPASTASRSRARTARRSASPCPGSTASSRSSRSSAFTFTEDRPATFWQAIQAAEYGFWANVNPEVPHPRWSQAMRARARHRPARPHPAVQRLRRVRRRSVQVSPGRAPLRLSL